MRVEIKSRFSGAVLFAAETESMRLAVELAVKARAYLAGAHLARANLADANLARANLADANLAGADLARAHLADAKLRAKGGLDLVLVGERPCLQIGPIGSRHDHMAAFITDAGVYVRAGCFWDTLDAFRRAVAETHGDNAHAQEYAAAITLIEAHARLWAPGTTTSATAETAEAQA